MKSYEAYTSEDFLQDEFFISWVRENNTETNEFWSKWLNAHQHKAEEVQIAKHAILNLRYHTFHELSDTEYTKIFEHVLKAEKEHKGIFSIFRNNHFLRYAAILLPIFVAAYFFYGQVTDHENMDEHEVAVSFEERYYPKGKRASLRLSDSTQISVNAASKIRFPSNFNGLATREVYLEGEAFFNVKRDTLKPFRVFTERLTTEVLGTSFNIEANPDSDMIQITVASGMVAVSDTSGNRIVLSPGELVTYSKKDNTFSKGFSKNLNHIIGWKDGKLIFYRKPIDQVFDVLEKWYDIEFVGEESITGFYTGNFQQESLQKVLEGIAYTSNFNYEIKGKSIFIYQK